MSEGLFVKHCSPTLAGIKTANLFSCTYSTKGEVEEALRRLNRSLGHKGLRAIALRYSEHKVLIYVYRPSRLKKDLSRREAKEILLQNGYTSENPNVCLRMLAGKLQQRADFPHEIGLFLGYPPEDVRGFIDNHAENYKCTGCWKVYGDADAARVLFARYKKCTDIYCKQWSMGKSIERLTVAV